MDEQAQRASSREPGYHGDLMTPRDPLHGVTLEMILTRLVERLGWEEMGRLIDIRCFNLDPSVSSSLKFLRRTPWARKKLEDLYLERCVSS